MDHTSQTNICWDTKFPITSETIDEKYRTHKGVVTFSLKYTEKYAMCNNFFFQSEFEVNKPLESYKMNLFMKTKLF